MPRPEVGEGRLRATVLFIDRFGNVALNLAADDATAARIVPDTRIEIRLALERYYALAMRTFADARSGELILYEDSYRNLAIAITGGDAAELLRARPGDDVLIRAAPE